jgi:8-oxo-dGTP diphosphatase
MNKNSIGIGVVVVVKNSGKILLGKRLVKVGYGQWGLPGGHLEYGESLTAGAKRELLEETGLKVDDLEFINITNDPRSGGKDSDDEHWIHFVFLAKGVRGEPKNTEPDKCEGWEWFSSDKLPKPIFFGHKKLLKAIFKNQLLSD